MEKNFVEWFNQLTAGDTQKVAAQKAGVVESTLSRQLSRGTFRPELVIALCRGYNYPPVDGLIETGYLHAHEVGSETPIRVALESATNRQILEELLRRSDPEARAMFGSTENGLVGIAADAEPLPPRGHPITDSDSSITGTVGRADYDHDALIDAINAGDVKIAAQEATEPLEEHQP